MNIEVTVRKCFHQASAKNKNEIYFEQLNTLYALLETAHMQEVLRHRLLLTFCPDFNSPVPAFIHVLGESNPKSYPKLMQMKAHIVPIIIQKI